MKSMLKKMLSMLVFFMVSITLATPAFASIAREYWVVEMDGYDAQNTHEIGEEILADELCNGVLVHKHDTFGPVMFIVVEGDEDECVDDAKGRVIRHPDVVELWVTGIEGPNEIASSFNDLTTHDAGDLHYVSWNKLPWFDHCPNRGTESYYTWLTGVSKQTLQSDQETTAWRFAGGDIDLHSDYKVCGIGIEVEDKVFFFLNGNEDEIGNLTTWWYSEFGDQYDNERIAGEGDEGEQWIRDFIFHADTDTDTVY